jgi:RNA recognition motif-containing protein
VGALEQSITQEELKDFFSQYGDVRECVIMKNMVTNQSRGFGFITMEDESIAS